MPAETPIRATTQQFLEIEDIQDDLVLLQNGACALILQVNAVNFGLLSEGEQDALIYAYAGLLNSLSFPVEILIRSQKKDVSAYLQLLKEQETRLKKPVLVEQMKKYREFVETTVKENEVLDKKFYVSIPFSPLELGVSSTLSQTVKPKKGLPYPKSYIFERAKTNLYPKRDHLIGQLGRLGLKSKQLTTQELLQLFYVIYNPGSMGQNFVPTKDYATPLVQAAITQMPVTPPPATKPAPTPPASQLAPVKATIPNLPPTGTTVASFPPSHAPSVATAISQPPQVAPSAAPLSYVPSSTIPSPTLPTPRPSQTTIAPNFNQPTTINLNVEEKPTGP